MKRRPACNEISKPSSNIDAVEIKFAIHLFDSIHCDGPKTPRNADNTKFNCVARLRPIEREKESIVLCPPTLFS